LTHQVLRKRLPHQDTPKQAEAIKSKQEQAKSSESNQK
jgi:hypothetical protein